TVTPLRQKLCHSLLPDRRRIHNLLFIPYHPPKISARGSVSGEISIQMITLIAISRFTPMKANHETQKEKDNNESTDQLQKNKNPPKYLPQPWRDLRVSHRRS